MWVYARSQDLESILTLRLVLKLLCNLIVHYGRCPNSRSDFRYYLTVGWDTSYATHAAKPLINSQKLAWAQAVNCQETQ